MNRFKSYFSVILLVWTHLTIHAQGILFHSNQTSINERTSYDVFSYKQPVFEEAFTVSFTLSVQKKKTFGYVLSINNLDHKDILSLLYVYNDSVSELRLNLEGKQNLIKLKLDDNEVGPKRKITCRIKFDLKQNQILFNANQHRAKTVYSFRVVRYQPKLIFGKTDHSIDVPSMRLRDLVVSGQNKTYSFPFYKSEGDVVYNAEGKAYGSIENPVWLINNSYHWRLKKQIRCNDVTAISFNEQNQKLIITQQDSIGFYDLITEQFSKMPTKNLLGVPMRLGMSLVRPLLQQIVVYELNDVASEINMATLSLETLGWDAISTPQFEQQRHHHNSWVDDENNRLYIFGGFGNRRFCNALNYFDFNTSSWHEVDLLGDEISPRFFSGMVYYSKHEVLLFAGVGNESGDQSLGKEYFKDCYRLNLNTLEVKKLWEFGNEETFVSSRNMVLSEDSLSFYTINYNESQSNTHLQLHQYKINDGASAVFGDTIPMISDRIRTNANLYLNKGTDELYCITQEFELDGSNIIRIYSIDFPPVTADHFIRKPIKEKNTQALVVVLGSFILLLTLSYIWVFRYKKVKSHREELSEVNLSKDLGENQEQKKNSISIFGNFKVLDQNGKDITYLFSPKLKQLLLLLILNITKEDGVSSQDIYDKLWPDKEKNNAKNLKNVTITQLRKITSDLNGLEIIYDKSAFKLIISEAIYIDFLDFNTHLQHFKDTPETSTGILYRILNKGPFLKGFDLDLFDKDKQVLENQSIRSFENAMEEYFKADKHQYLIKVARGLLAIDSVNETALFYMLATYKKLKMTIDAKKVYNAFLVEYLKVYEEDYDKTFGEIMSHSPQKLLAQKS